jgi:hypothetical protein
MQKKRERGKQKRGKKQRQQDKGRKQERSYFLLLAIPLQIRQTTEKALRMLLLLTILSLTIPSARTPTQMEKSLRVLLLLRIPWTPTHMWQAT